MAGRVGKISTVYTQEQVAFVAADIVSRLAPGTIVTLEGPLGAGKTTLVREILGQLGVQGAITSATFGYVNTYQAASGPIHHFDLYRISTAEEFCQAGFEEYLADQEAVVLVEWPAVIQPVLARYNTVIALRLAYDPDDISVRVLSIV